MSYYDRMKSVKEMFGHYTTEPTKREPDGAWDTQAGGENDIPVVTADVERTYMDPKFVNVRKNVVRKGINMVVDTLARAATGGPKVDGPKEFGSIFKNYKHGETCKCEGCVKKYAGKKY